jgi:hypothetical protein
LPYYNSAIGGNLSPAEKAATTRVLEEFQHILLQVPELAFPKGFEVMPQFWGGSRKLGPGARENPKNIVEYMLNLYFFAPTKAIAGEGCVCISVTVNLQNGMNGMTDEQGREIYFEPERGDPLPLATQVYGRLWPRIDDAPVGHDNRVQVILTSGGEPFWKTVTRKEYYNAVILSTQGKDGAKLADARKSLEKTLSGMAGRRCTTQEGSGGGPPIDGSNPASHRSCKDAKDIGRQRTRSNRQSQSRAGSRPGAQPGGVRLV